MDINISFYIFRIEAQSNAVFNSNKQEEDLKSQRIVINDNIFKIVNT